MKRVCGGEADEHRPVTISALGGWRMIFDGRFKYIDGEGESEFLYDLRADPDERNDVLNAHVKEARGLRRRLDEETRNP